jgi:hypothetical protein
MNDDIIGTLITTPEAELSDAELRSRWRFNHWLTTGYILWGLGILFGIIFACSDQKGVSHFWGVIMIVGSISLIVVSSIYLRLRARTLTREQMIIQINANKEANRDMPS